LTVQSIVTITPAEAVEILRGYGMKIGRSALCAGIQQGSFPFGTFIQMENEVYFIYLAQLNRWIADRLMDEEVPEVPVDA